MRKLRWGQIPGDDWCYKLLDVHGRNVLGGWLAKLHQLRKGLLQRLFRRSRLCGLCCGNILCSQRLTGRFYLRDLHGRQLQRIGREYMHRMQCRHISVKQWRVELRCLSDWYIPV